MRVRHIGSQAAVLGLILGFGAPITTAHAATKSRHIVHSSGHYAGHGVSVAHYFHGGLQCVPFARENTGIELAGNAANWWGAAAGVYERGAKPEVGSVLNFRANGRMRMGHVAVVSNVVDSREIEIDHANWAGPGAVRGGVSRNITVVDVSPSNDWSAVRVALGHTEQFGSVYPTYGFIYDRPDRGVMVANDTTAPARALNTPPADLRPATERFAAASAQDTEEVAEASDDVQPRSHRFGSRHGVHAHVIAATAHGTARHPSVTRVAAHAAPEPHTHHTTVRHRT
jgi:surface antigen